MVKVMSLRLPDELYDELVEVADEAGIPPAVLARAWVKQNLEDRSVEDAIAGAHPIEKISIPGVGLFVRKEGHQQRSNRKKKKK